MGLLKSFEYFGIIYGVSTSLFCSGSSNEFPEDELRVSAFHWLLGFKCLQSSTDPAAYDKTPEGERFSGLILGVCEGKIHIQYHSNCEDQLQCWLLMVEISLFGSVTD